MLVWIGCGCLSVHFPIPNPLVDGTWDAMLRAICDPFVIGHALVVNINEWVQVIERAPEGGLISAPPYSCRIPVIPVEFLWILVE